MYIYAYVNKSGSITLYITIHSFPNDSADKESACNARDRDLIPGSGRSLGEDNGNPLQYSYLENPVNRGD